MNATTSGSVSKMLLTVEEAAEVLSIGRTKAYDLVMRKRIVSVKVGGARRIPVFALTDYLDHLLSEQKGVNQ